MKKYFSFCILYFKDMSAYKADVALSMIINSAFFIISFVIWNAVYTGGGLTEINNYTLSTTITYFLIGAVFFRMDFAEQIMLTEWIWYGDLVKDLVKPWNIKFVQFIMYISNIFYNVAMYIPVLIILFLFFHNYVLLPSLLYFIYFLITVGLITILGLVFFGIFHSLTFFYGDQSSQIGLTNYLVAGMAGGFFPLDFLPTKIAWVFNHLPFRFFFNTPAKVFLQKFTPLEIYYNWAEIIMWILIFYAIFHYLYKKGLKQFSGVGL